MRHACSRVEIIPIPDSLFPYSFATPSMIVLRQDLGADKSSIKLPSLLDGKNKRSGKEEAVTTLHSKSHWFLTDQSTIIESKTSLTIRSASNMNFNQNVEPLHPAKKRNSPDC